MKRMEVVVIGAGQAGLAMSRSLADLGVRHVVLERGTIAERWRSTRWESLRLLTPRWQSRLPGWSYDGPDPDGFMSREELVRFLEDYARSFDAPVETGVEVRSLREAADGFRIETSRDDYQAAQVVIATGYCDVPHVPALAARLPAGVLQLVPERYRNPAELPPGGVLVVGASASGIQLAAEIRRAGRPVTLAVGSHLRLPRRYRGADILYWMEQAGYYSDRAADVSDLAAARRSPSFQLSGAYGHATLDLARLRELGVRLAGRLEDVEGPRVRFALDLSQSVAAADVPCRRVLERIDRHIARTGVEAPPAEPLAGIRTDDAPEFLDLAAEGIGTVLWATGYRRRYDWLRVPLLDEAGEIRHVDGLTPVAGLYVLGMRFQVRRSSSFLDGVGEDARELARVIARRASPGSPAAA